MAYYNFKPLAFAALVIAAVIILIWLRIGSVGTVSPPVEQAAEVEQVAVEPPLVDLPASGHLSDGEQGAKREPIDVSFPETNALLGRVFDPDGNPVAGAIVALLVLGPDGPDKDLKMHVKTARNGEFVLNPPIAMRGLGLALIARHPGFRPASVPFRIAKESEQHDLKLNLERGYAIEGRVVRHGMPVADMSVDVDLRWLVSGVHGIGKEAFWIDGRLEEKHVRAKTDHNGWFRIVGLGRQEHHLRVSGRWNGAHINHEEQVWAPTTGLEIDLTQTEIAITVRQSGIGFSGAWIQVSHGTGFFEEQSKADQPTVIEVPTGAEIRIRVLHDSSEVIEETVTAPTKGSRLRLDIDLVRVARPDLRLHLRGARAQGIERIEARILGGGQDTARLLALVPRGDFFSWSSVPVPPGRYTLAVGPRVGTSGQYLLASSQPIVLPSVGIADVEIVLRLGGLFEFHLDRRDGNGFSGKARLLDDSGKEVWQQTWQGGWNFALGRGGMGMPAPKAHQHHDYKSLVPGKYRLTVEGEGARLIDRAVVIRPGETTREEVKL